jgi:hypothetical protein
MSRRLQAIVSRILLMVALLTFLSPTLGWELTATHEQLEHTALALGVPDHDAHSGDGEHDTAHGLMGHVLTHMPAHLVSMVSIAPPQAVFSRSSPPQHAHSNTVPEPPFIPPRSSAAA